MRKAASLALVLGALCCAPLQAQVLYKWTDDQGRTQYSDRPPKNFKGEVTRIEPDARTTPVAPAAPAPATAPERLVPEGPVKAEPAKDMATRRRDTRAVLEARLMRARAQLEVARKALEEAGGPGLEESQVVQQRIQAGQGGMHGQSSARSTCRALADAAGKKFVVCNATVPTDQYFERVTRLELAVKTAEDELGEAEQAYRRGVD